MADLEFLGPYDTMSLMKGVVEALPVKRPIWLQSFFPAGELVEADSIGLDELLAEKNTMGIWAAPTADVDPVKLPEYFTRKVIFGYSKEPIVTPTLEEINKRAAGDPIGTRDIARNEETNILKQFAKAEQRFENLFELIARDIFFYGKYTAEGEKHPKIVYDFERTVTATESDLNNGPVSEVNLTTLNANGGVGKRAWGSTGGTKSPTPVEDLKTMIQTANEYSGCAAVLMSKDAYIEFNKDLTTNYASAANLTNDVLFRTQLDILPKVEKFDGLNFQRLFTFGNGESIGIYTYDSYYHDRVTGAKTKYVPDGYVVAIPKGELHKFYGRIQHRKARYLALPRYIHYWENQKTGHGEWEIHTAPLFATVRANGCVAWKVK